jgi:hypothetical protein
MPRSKELTVAIPDKPGALADCLRVLAEQGVNVIGFQSFVEEGESLARFLVDEVAGATKALGNHRMIFEVTEVVVTKLQHRPGELARVASCLGEQKINVNYCYCGREAGSGSTLALAVFGVDNLPKAVTALDQLAAQNSGD